MVMRTPFLKSILLTCLLVVFGLTAQAQADVDSPYSLFGLGQMNNKSTNVRLDGMGGVANAMYGNGLINIGNPASYAKIDSLAFLFDAGFYFKSSTFSTSTLSEKARCEAFYHFGLQYAC